jgi:hypothetical protein
MTRIVQGHRNYSADPDAVYVSIYCTGDVVANDAGEVEHSHEADPWLIRSFVWGPEDDDNPAGAWRWHEDPFRYWRDQTSGVRLSGRARASLVGDRHVSQAEWKADPLVFDAGSRTRYRFECQTCGLTVERKAPIVYDVLTVLAKAGQREVSLRFLKRALDVLAAIRG